MSAPVTPQRAVRHAYFSDPAVRLYLALGTTLAVDAAARLGAGRFCALALVGWGVFLVEEYVSHVVVFHGCVPRNQRLYGLLYRLHIGHHDRPRRVDLLFTPLWYTLPALLLDVAVLAWLTGSARDAEASAAGLVFGYLLFEWCHLVVHSPLEPGPVLRHVRERHMGHHHWNARRWFTVSPPALALDALFGTAGPVHAVPRGASPMTLGLDEADPRLQAARRRHRGGSDWTEEASALWRPERRRAVAASLEQPHA